MSARYGDRRPEWSMRPGFAFAYGALALVMSVTVMWWAGPAMVALLGVFYLLAVYAPWLGLTGRG